MKSQESHPSTIQEEESLVRQLLQLPDTDSMVFIDQGWDSRVYVVHDGAAMFKFPRGEFTRQGFRTEIAVLDLLSSLVLPVQIPVVQWRDPAYRYFDYQGVVGVRLSDPLPLTSENEQNRLGTAIGWFLRILHAQNLDAPRMPVEEEAQEYQYK